MAEKVMLCGSCSSCPCVEVEEEGVRIGEEGRGWFTLTREEWNILVTKIASGELKALK